MGDFIGAAFGYPTAIWTALLGVVLFYWVLALIGVVDFESGGFDVDLQADGSADDLGALAGFIVAFGLGGVPFSVVVSLIVLISWTASCLLAMWVLPLVPTQLLQILAGTAVLLGSAALSLPITAMVVRPLRGMFVTHAARTNEHLIGHTCHVRTQTVTSTFGQAVVTTRGASLHIDVRADEPNTFASGSAALIVHYDAAAERYTIAPEP